MTEVTFRSRICLAALVMSLIAMAGSAMAQTLQPGSNHNELDPAVVEAFVDAAMHQALSETWAPGLVVTIVQGETLILAKGYGVADIETRAPIDPEHSLFRIASITKLFTTVAALRLLEQGKLDLDRDINDYLTRVEMPEAFGQPITTRQLLTHRGGFDTAVGYMDFPDEQAARQTPEQMTWDIRRVRPAAALPIYDNMGFGVLGLVLADILDTSYDEAIRELVFTPIGMTQSVAGLPEDRLADAVQSHQRNAQWHAERIPQNIMPTSAQGGGDISSTAADMGKFLSSLLVPGKLLAPATLSAMTDFNAWRFHPRIPGLGLGMWQYFYDGHEAEGHRGEINGFISRLAVFREADIGVFVSVNSTVQSWPQPRLSYALSHLAPPQPPPQGAPTLDPDTLIDGFLVQFAGHFLSAPAAIPQADPLAAGEKTTHELAGVYFRLDASSHLMARILATLEGQKISALSDGQLALWGCPFQRLAPMYYQCRAPNGDTVSLGFRVMEGDRIFASVQPVGALERQPPWRQAPLALWPIPVVLLLGLSAFALLPKATSASAKQVLKLAGSAAALTLIALLLELEFAYDLAHSALHSLPVVWRVLFPIAAVLALISVLLTFALPVLRTAPFAASSKRALLSIHFVVLALGNLGLVWLIFLWDLQWPF